MSHHLTGLPHIDEQMHECIDNCSDCHDVCVATIRYCLDQGGDHASPGHIEAMLDCAATCDACRDLMLHGSELHHASCALCARACERCAESCESFGDDEVMSRCAELCRRCAASCRQMA